MKLNDVTWVLGQKDISASLKHDLLWCERTKRAKRAKYVEPKPGQIKGK